MVKKPKFFERSLYYLFGTALTVLSLPVSVLSRPLPKNTERGSSTYDNTKDIMENQSAMEQYNEDRHQETLEAIKNQFNNLFSYLKGNFTTENYATLNETQTFANQTLLDSQRLSAELRNLLKLTRFLNQGEFFKELEYVSGNMSNFTSSFKKLLDFHELHTDILLNAAHASQNNTNAILDFLKNNATSMFDYFKSMQKSFDEKKSHDVGSYGMQVAQTALLVAMSGALIYNIYKLSKVNKRLDDMEVSGKQLNQQI